MANYISTHTGTEIDSAVDKVNNLHATDVVASNLATVQANLERIDGRIDDLTATDIACENGYTVQRNLDLIAGEVADVQADVDGKLDASKNAVATVGGLVTPTVVLSNNEIVGVGTDGSQTRIQLGDGLELTGSTSPYTLRVVAYDGTVE